MTRKLTVLTEISNPDLIDNFCAEGFIRHVNNGHDVDMGIACCGNLSSKIYIDSENKAVQAVDIQLGADQLDVELNTVYPKNFDVWLKNLPWKEQKRHTHCRNQYVIINLTRYDYVTDYSHVSEFMNQAAIYAGFAHNSSIKYPLFDYIRTILHPETVERPV